EKRRPPGPPFPNPRWRGSAALHEPGKLLVEARQPPATVHQLLLAAGPGRVGGGVDVQGHLLARGAVGGARPVGGAVVQLNFDKVIIRVDTLLHDAKPSSGCRPFRRAAEAGLYGRGLQPASSPGATSFLG